MKNGSFIAACENPDLRPIFVKSIDLGEVAKFISRVEYSPEDFYVGPRGFGVKFSLGFHPNTLSLYGVPKRKGKVVIYPDAFSRFATPIENLEDFRSALIHHEGEHAKQHYEHAIKIALHRLFRMDEKLHHLLERGAYANQAKYLNGRNSEGFRQQVWDKLKMHHLNLQG